MRLFALSFLVLFSTGCDADGDSLLGEFVGNVQLSDQRPEVVEGEAVYTVVETADGPEFLLGLFVGDLTDSRYDEYDYVLFRRPGDLPGVGAYPIDDDPDRTFSATLARRVDEDDEGALGNALLYGTDGTLALSQIDGYGFVMGTYAFSAEGVRVAPASGQVEGRASGRFEARYETPAAFQRLGLGL